MHPAGLQVLCSKDLDIGLKVFFLKFLLILKRIKTLNILSKLYHTFSEAILSDWSFLYPLKHHETSSFLMFFKRIETNQLHEIR